MRDSVRPDAVDLLQWMKQLDRTIGGIVPAGSSVTIATRLHAEATELFFLARRTFGSVFLLMSWSLWTTDTDRTEDAATLLRKLLDIYARIVFIAQGDPDGPEREVRASRAALADARDHIRMLEAAFEISGREDHQTTLEDWRTAVEELADQVAEHTSTTGMPPTTSILEGVSPLHALLWRELSDVSHGGVMGRSYQRDGLTFGVPATPERQDRIMEESLAIMAETFTIWLDLNNVQSSEWGSFSDSLQKVLAGEGGEQ